MDPSSATAVLGPTRRATPEPGDDGEPGRSGLELEPEEPPGWRELVPPDTLLSLPKSQVKRQEVISEQLLPRRGQLGGSCRADPVKARAASAMLPTSSLEMAWGGSGGQRKEDQMFKARTHEDSHVSLSLWEAVAGGSLNFSPDWTTLRDSVSKTIKKKEGRKKKRARNNMKLLPLLPSFYFQVSLCSPGCPGTHSVNQASLELTEILLPLPLECWDFFIFILCMGILPAFTDGCELPREAWKSAQEEPLSFCFLIQGGLQPLVLLSWPPKCWVGATELAPPWFVCETGSHPIAEVGLELKILFSQPSEAEPPAWHVRSGLAVELLKKIHSRN
ncbi:rho guanine nucleotide exchange factor 1 isoform X1, partial [Sigmodon hispidus]